MEKALALDPDDREARLSYMSILQRLEAFDAIVAETEDLLDRDPSWHAMRIYRGLAEQALGRDAAAIEDFERVADDEGAGRDDRMFALDMIADLGLRFRDFDKVLAALDRKGDANRGFADGIRRTLALEGLGRDADAEAVVRQALREAETTEEKASGLRALGEIAIKRGDLAGADEAYGDALRIRPGDPDLLRGSADVAYRRGDATRALGLAREAFSARAEPETREFLANLLYATGDYAGAIEQFQAIAADRTDADDRRRISMSLGYAYLASDRRDEAADAFRAALGIESDVAASLALAQVLEDAGQAREAILELERARETVASPEIAARLGILHAQIGEPERALPELRAALAAEELSAETAHRLRMTEGYILADLGRQDEAASAFKSAAAIRSDTATLLALARARDAAGQANQAIDVLKRALERDPSPEIQVQLGTLYARSGRDRQALATLRRAIAAGPPAAGSPEIRMQLGHIYVKLGRDKEARDAFRRALDLEPSPQARLYAGLASQKLGDARAAEGYLLAARSGEGALTVGERRQLLNTLGFALDSLGEHERARAAWQESLALADDPVIAVSLARAQRLGGSREEAQRILAALPPFALPPSLQAAALSEQAYLAAGNGDIDRAMEAERLALSLDPSAQRRYQLALYLQQAGQPDAALGLLQAVAAEEPDNGVFAMSAAYAYASAEDYATAERAFINALDHDPANVGTHKEIAYLAARRGDPREAAEWFRRAIDLRRAEADGEAISAEEDSAASDQERADRERADQERNDDIYAMRQEVRRLSNWWNLTAYQSFASNDRDARATATSTTGGIVPSQGGVEMAVRPPVIGFVDERIFEVFGRLFWSNQAATLRPDGDTALGGVGFRYKPLKSRNLYVGAERLFELGRDSDSNWLLRASYGWEDGLDLRIDRSNWNYSLLYADLGYFVESPATVAFYGEARQGRSFKLGDRVTISPHAVIDGRVQDRDTSDFSYIEGGVGVALKWYFNDSSYEAFGSSIELSAQYKAEIVGFGSGLVVTAVARF